MSNDTISPFPLCSTIAIRMQSVSRIDPIPPQIMKARAAVLHRVARKLRAWPAQPSDTQARKVHSSFFSYTSSLLSTHRRATGRGRGMRGAARSRRLRTQTHDGESDCSTSPGSFRDISRRYLRNFRMLYINSDTAPIFRAAMHKRYLEYNKHVLILLCFIVEYQLSY